MMKFKFVAAIVLAATSMAAAQQQLARLATSSHQAASAAVVARVNGVPLSENDLKAGMQLLFPYYATHGGKIPPGAEKEIRQRALDRLVLEELIYQEARRRNLQVLPAKLEARIRAARKQYASAAQFQSIIAQQYGSQAEFRRRAARALLVETLWKKVVSRPAVPGQADIRNYYRQNKARFVRPESVALQTISFLFAQNAPEAERMQSRQRAEALLPQAQATTTLDEFGALAEKHSQDDWRVMNGDHGWVHRGSVEPELNAAFAMQPGQVSGIIASRAGFHILRVNGHRPQTQLPFAEVKKLIRQSLHQEREARLRQQFEQSLRRKARIEVL